MDNETINEPLVDNKPLTPAQQEHLRQLNDDVGRAIGDLDRFTAYLRAEHQAPAPDWIIVKIDQGFIPNPARARDPDA